MLALHCLIRRAATSGAAVGLIVIAFSATSVFSASADDTGKSDKTLAGLVDSSVLTTPALVKGTVQAANGRGAGGSKIVLYAWPSNEVMEGQRVGDSVNLQAVATTTADATGTFALRLRSDERLTEWADHQRLVNFTVVAGDGGAAASWSFARRLGTSGGAAPGTTARTVLALPGAEGNAPAAPAEGVSLHLASASASSELATPGAVGVAQKGTVVKSCLSAFVQEYPSVWVLVGQNYSSTAYASANYQYYSDAVSTLGVGTSVSGSYGSFKSSGTMSKSSSSSVDFPTTKGAASRYHDTKYKYAKYRLTCVVPGGVPYQYYEVRPYKYVSGSRERSVGLVAAGYCATFANGSKFTADRTSSITWTDGADMSDIVGIDFSVQTGYTTRARIQWAFSATRRLCGTADYPGEGTYRQLRARK